jgi:peptide-methionine (R)-S-oxide reductase
MPSRREFTRLAAVAALSYGAFKVSSQMGSVAKAEEHFEVEKSDAEWQRILTPEQYDVLRHQGTEPAGTSPLDANEEPGIYNCAGCALPLYSSKTKFHSGTGWPSFWQPLDNAISTSVDTSAFMTRTEVHCRRCGGHLGHVFEDGPKPTGLRYCMNGVALAFVPKAAG